MLQGLNEYNFLKSSKKTLTFSKAYSIQVISVFISRHSMASPMASTILSVPHCPTKLKPIGNRTSFLCSACQCFRTGMESAGSPANEEGTVRTSCTYVFSSDLGPELLSDNSGAVRIADGCKRISIQGEIVGFLSFSEEVSEK